MTAFKNLSTPEEIKKYQFNILSRTGGKNKCDVFLYHYTSFAAVHSILTTKYIWLGSSEKMNDFLEGEFIDSVDSQNKLFFTCFSRAEENLAMYKMYAANPNGAMMTISYKLAQDIINNLPSSGGKKIVKIVRNNEVTNESIEADIYWASIIYKELHSDLIRSETVYNNNFKNPLSIPEFAGFIKLHGWEYEKEVRLCVFLPYRLNSNEKIALKLPEGIENGLSIVTAPNFKNDLHRKEISELRRLGYEIRSSEYDGLVDLGENYSEHLSKLEKENKELICKMKKMEEKIDNNPRTEKDNEILFSDLTNDEKAVISYVYSKQIKKIQKDELQDWITIKEIVQINIDNAFELLSCKKAGKFLGSKSLDLDYTAFKKIIQSDIKKEVNAFIRENSDLSRDRFFDAWKNGFFSDSTKMLLQYYIDNRKITTMVGSYSSQEKEKIQKWQFDYRLIGLDEKYEVFLSEFDMFGLFDVFETTCYGNPKEYRFKTSLAECVLSDGFEYKKEIQKLIKRMELPF